MDRELRIARKLCRKHQTNNPFQICDKLGYLVIFVPLHGIRGFYQHIIRINLIYIDDSLPERTQRFVCAHELGHALMHRNSNAIFLDSRTLQIVGKFEKSANRFSAGILYPDDDELLEYASFSIDQISQILSLPPELVEWRYNQIESVKNKTKLERL